MISDFFLSSLLIETALFLELKTDLSDLQWICCGSILSLGKFLFFFVFGYIYKWYMYDDDWVLNKRK